MPTSLKCSLGIALSLLTATAAVADGPLPLPRADVGGQQTFPGYGAGYGYWSGTSSIESILRGRATLIRSVGERNLLDAEARRSNVEAYSHHIDNVVKEQDARFALRRAGEAEQSLRHDQIHARRSLQMAINDAEQIVNNGGSPSAAVETRAEARLRLALSLWRNGKQEQAIHWLRDITQQYANTAAGYQAAQILKDLNT